MGKAPNGAGSHGADGAGLDSAGLQGAGLIGAGLDDVLGMWKPSVFIVQCWLTPLCLDKDT